MNLPYKEFVTKAASLVPCCPKDYEVCYTYSYGSPPIDSKTNLDDLFLFDVREVGGYSGGGCWDDSDPQPYTTNEPFSDYLDTILETFSPDVTYLEYKQICKQYIIEEQEQREYYGNSTEYQIRKLSLKWLYEYLISKGFLQREQTV